MQLWILVLLTPSLFPCFGRVGAHGKNVDEDKIYKPVTSTANVEHFYSDQAYNGRTYELLRLSDEAWRSTNYEDNGPLIDEMEYDDYEDYDLEEIRRFSEKPLEERKWNYAEEDKVRARDYHNIYRSNQTKPIPELLNVHFIEWDNVMEWQAEEWSDMCVFAEHGKPKSSNESYSQNLYFGPSPIASRAMYLWYEEYRYYDFTHINCSLKNATDRYTCGHFTCMMWHDSVGVGCGRQYCWPRDKWFIITCHYISPGNRVGEKPFQPGKACNKCYKTKSGLCWNNLCVNKRQCTAYKLEGCKCNLQCENCGLFHPETCTCTCRDGWDQDNCAEPCWDTHKACGGSEPKRRFLCRHEWSYGFVRYLYCRKWCKVCNPVDPKKKYALCCAGKHCPEGYTLNATDCSCVVDCPGILCHYGTTEVAYVLTEHINSLSPTLIHIQGFLMYYFLLVCIVNLIINPTIKA